MGSRYRTSGYIRVIALYEIGTGEYERLIEKGFLSALSYTPESVSPHNDGKGARMLLQPFAFFGDCRAACGFSVTLKPFEKSCNPSPFRAVCSGSWFCRTRLASSEIERPLRLFLQRDLDTYSARDLLRFMVGRCRAVGGCSHGNEGKILFPSTLLC